MKKKSSYDYYKYLKTAIIVKQINNTPWHKFKLHKELNKKLEKLNHK